MAPSKQKKDFFWVNKNAAAASLSCSQRAEKQRIFQFVQNQRVRPAGTGNETNKHRRRSVVRGATDPGPFVQPTSAGTRRYRPLSIRPVDGAPLSSLRPSQSSGRSPPAQPTQHVPSNNTRKSSSPSPVANRVARLCYHGQSIPTLNQISGSGVDPFSASPMPMTKNIEVLINYFCVMISTGSHVDKTEVLPAHLQPSRRFAKIRDMSIRVAMQDKIEFASLMVIMSSRMVHLSRIPLTGLARPEYYMHLALAAVREKTLDCQGRSVPGDRILVHGIHSLALSDWICQRFEAASTHVRAVKVLLPLLDLDDPLDEHIAQGTFNVDKMIAIETGWLPEFPLMFDPGPLDPGRMSVIQKELEEFASGRLESVMYPRSPVPNASNLSSAIMSYQTDFLADASSALDFGLGSGFKNALAARVLDGHLSTIIGDVLDVLTVAKYVWRTPNATRDDAGWMCKRARAICYRLLALSAQLAFPESSVHAAKTEALRIALLLVILRCTNRMSFRSAQPNMRRLHRALSLHGIDTSWSAGGPDKSARRLDVGISSDTETYDENALLLWVLMTGLFSAEGEPEELWFIMRAAYVAERHLGIKDAHGLKEVMGQYLYSKTQQEKSLLVVSLHLSR